MLIHDDALAHGQAHKSDMSRNQLLALVSAAMALSALATDMMLPAFADMREAFHLRPGSADTAYVVTSFMMGLAVSQLLWGPIADRYGRRPTLYGGLIIYGASAMACAFAPSFGWLLAARFVWGIGAAGARVGAEAIVRDRFVGEAMARAMSQVMAVFLIVPIFAPSLGSLVLLFATWRWVFVISALIVLPIAVWGVRLKESLDPSEARPINGAAVWAAFRQVATTRVTAGYMISSVFLQGVMVAYLASSEVLIGGIFDRQAQFPFVFGAVGVVFSIGALSNGWIVARAGIRRTINVAFAIIIPVNAVLLLVSLLTHGRPSFWVFMPLVGAMLGSFMMLMPNLNAAAMVPMGNIAGTASAVMGAARLGFGAMLGALVAQHVAESTTPFVIGTAVMCSCAGLAVIYGRGAATTTLTSVDLTAA